MVVAVVVVDDGDGDDDDGRGGGDADGAGAAFAPAVLMFQCQSTRRASLTPFLPPQPREQCWHLACGTALIAVNSESSCLAQHVV